MEYSRDMVDLICNGSQENYDALMNMFAYRRNELQGIDNFVDDLTDRANSGNAIAQAFVATLYLNGFGVPVNLSKALSYSRRSAGLGQPCGEVVLGIMYLYGYEISADPSRALYWFKMARTNAKEAFNYYQKAANANNPVGIFNLGCCYEVGYGTKRNIGEAVRLYQLAAPNFPHAQKVLNTFKQ
jgi:TPR repeat protein